MSPFQFHAQCLCSCLVQFAKGYLFFTTAVISALQAEVCRRTQHTVVSDNQYTDGYNRLMFFAFYTNHTVNCYPPITTLNCKDRKQAEEDKTAQL